MDKEYTHSSPLNSRKFRLKYQHEDPEFEERQMVLVRCNKCPRWPGSVTPVGEMKKAFADHQQRRHLHHA